MLGPGPHGGAARCGGAQRRPELLQHARHASGRQAQDCRDLVRACALGAGAMPNELRAELTSVVHTSANVIHASHTVPPVPGRTLRLENA